MNFKPHPDYLFVEPVFSDNIIKDDGANKTEIAKLVGENKYVWFRPHGYFETEFKGTKAYVVRNDPEFILGYFNVEE